MCVCWTRDLPWASADQQVGEYCNHNHCGESQEKGEQDAVSRYVDTRLPMVDHVLLSVFRLQLPAWNANM